MKATAVIVAAAVAFLWGVGYLNHDKATSAPVADASPASDEHISQAAPRPDPPAVTLEEQIGRVRHLMSDESNAISPGAAPLVLWSTEHLTWAQFATIKRTKRAQVMKDADSERGKVICVSGRIIEISVQAAKDHKVNVGGMYDASGGIYRFINVGSSGELVEQSAASMCGVVVGRVDYSNSIGGVAHAIQLVGMFDLPENRKAKSSRQESGSI